MDGVMVQPAAERVLVGRVLLACLQAPDPGLQNPVVVDLARRCDSRVLLNAAHRHALTAALHLQLAGGDGVSTEVAEVLELRWRAQAARELRIRADLRSLLPALAPAAGRWCFVKGPVLAHLAYPRPDAREYADLDLLVDRRSLGPVLEALEAAGASVHDRNWPLVHQSMRGELTVILPFGTILDLHWHLITERSVRADFTFAMDPVLDAVRPVSWDGETVQAPGPADMLLHLCAHAVLSGGQKLAWWQDVANVVRHDPPDWDLFTRRAADSGLGLVSAVMLERACKLLEVPLPSGLLDGLARRRGWRTVVTAADARRSVLVVHDGALTGQTMLASTRGSTRASLARLTAQVGLATRDVVRNREHPWRHRGQIGSMPPDNPLHQDRGGAARRMAFLDDLASARREP